MGSVKNCQHCLPILSCDLHAELLSQEFKSIDPLVNCGYEDNIKQLMIHDSGARITGTDGSLLLLPHLILLLFPNPRNLQLWSQALLSQILQLT